MRKNKLEVTFNIKSVDEKGKFTGYGSVFDVVDSYDDIVEKGAFKNTLDALKSTNGVIPILWQHNSSEPIGTFTTIKEDDYGLYVEGQLLIDDVNRAKEAHALMKAKAVSGLSIGYRLNKYEYDVEEELYHLTDIDLREISIVTFPACNEARITDVKSKLSGGELPTLKEFEKFLRESGFSKTQATAIANGGLSKLHKEQSESVSVFDGVLNILQN